MGGRLVPAWRWPYAPQNPQLESWAVGVPGALLGGFRASPGVSGLPRCAVYSLGLVGPAVIPCEVWTDLKDQKEVCPGMCNEICMCRHVMIEVGMCN